MDKLYKSNKIEVRKSPVHGWGVFAKEDIEKGELLEECHFIPTWNNACENINKYKFVYPSYKKGMDVEQWELDMKFQAVCLGYGGIYNNNKNEKEVNVKYDWEKDRVLLIFTSTKRVKKDEELFLYYSSNDRPNCKCKGEI